MAKTTNNDSTVASATKAAAIYLLKRGLASYSEIADISGRSRQIIRHWAKDYPNARAEYLAQEWDKAVKKSAK